MQSNPTFVSAEKNGNQTIVEIAIGNKPMRFSLPSNAPVTQLNQAVTKRIRMQVQAYLNCRERAFKAYNTLTSDRLQALQLLRQRIAENDRLTFQGLTIMLDKYRDNLLMLLPCTKSRYYKNQSQLVFDLYTFSQNPTIDVKGIWTKK